MSTEELINEQPGKNRNLIILIILSSVFIIYYSIMALLSPEKKLKEITNEFALKKDTKIKVDERIFSDSAYLKLLKEKAYLQSRISMAETDSVYLTINLADSSVNLEISGVVVHKTKVKKIKLSKIFAKGNEYIISTMLSSPFTIADDISSIKKEPLLIKMAPKDTSEYQPDVIPDTADFEPVNYMLEMHNGVRIFFYQEERSMKGDGSHFFWFDLHYRLHNVLSSLKRIMLLKVPEYHPYIKLRLPRADAKNIYRAIPVHGQVAVYR
jgi:hypothetical protein